MIANISEIDITLIEVNEGQLSQIDRETNKQVGIPRNPRFIRDERFEALKKSISDAPEMLEIRPILVYTLSSLKGKDGKYIAIGGNMRLRACKDLGYTSIPCIIIDPATPMSKLREYAVKDNEAFGQNDYDILANEWDPLELADWGMELNWDISGNTDDEDYNEGQGETSVLDEEAKRDEEVEKLLNEAMKQYCGEFVEQIDTLQAGNGTIISGYTEGYAKTKFIRAKYYGEKYPQNISLCFHSHQIKTAGSKESIYYLLCECAKKCGAGIAGFRTVSQNGTLVKAFLSSYPIGGARMPLDFPSSMARDLILEFAGKGAKILDPCHGWGGRFVGALLAECYSYTGCDPCEETHNGLLRMKDAYMPYCADSTKEVDFICKPYEECNFEQGSFDFAITSPPYFDTEKYGGENSSHKKFPTYDMWKYGFYKPLISNTFRWLKPGGCSA